MEENGENHDNNPMSIPHANGYTTGAIGLLWDAF
jgi:hypothetical protein